MSGERVDPLPEALRRGARRTDGPWFPTFDDVVLAWLNSEAHLAVEAIDVLEVLADGTDWAGDTEGGFYAEFDLEIRYATRDGVERMPVHGEDLASLWRFVMRSWPDPAEVGR